MCLTWTAIPIQPHHFVELFSSAIVLARFPPKWILSAKLMVEALMPLSNILLWILPTMYFWPKHVLSSLAILLMLLVVWCAFFNCYSYAAIKEYSHHYKNRMEPKIQIRFLRNNDKTMRWRKILLEHVTWATEISLTWNSKGNVSLHMYKIKTLSRNPQNMKTHC